MLQKLASMRRRYKSAIILAVDLVLLVFCFFAALILRLNDPWPIEWFINSLNVLLLMLVSTIILTFLFRLHLKKTSSFDFRSANDVLMMIATLTVITFTANIFFNMGAPRTTPLITGPLFLLSIFGSRLIALKMLQRDKLRNLNRTPIAIYGAGSAGTQLATMLTNSPQYAPVLFVDENPNLHGIDISGIRVYKPSRLKEFVDQGRIKEIFLAIPSLKQAQKRRFGEQLSNIGCKVQEIPSYEEIIRSGDLISSLRVINPEELLGRNKVQIEMSNTNLMYENANVFVSGAGGSIGSELCRKIIKTKPKRLVLFEISEFCLYSIEKELRPIADELGIELIPALGSVCDSLQLTRLFNQYDIRVVLHAAAYKHVPLVEANILEGIKNNIFGTKIIAETAVECGIKHFTLISTDKAVRPTSVMGATKRLAELVLQNLHDKTTSDCKFSMVRFGNVLGSSGSVIPLFKQQIQQGGPVVVTHEDVTRYFMTIPEAAQLVLVASSYAKGGEVFVLDMGEPVKIMELARSMIELSGYEVRDKNNPHGDIEIKIGKLRPGEKLYEELLVGKNMLTTPHPKIMCAAENLLSSKQINTVYKKLEKSITNQDFEDAKSILFDTIKKCDAV